MNIAVLSINIGKYICYWKEFYETAKQNFLPMHNREFYVFTDHCEIDYGLNEDVHIIFQKNLGWPGNTLKRFHMFSGQKQELQRFDYIFFINANCVFVEKIGDEILPSEEEKFVFVKRQPSYLNKKDYPPFEQNPLSTAYVEDRDITYIQGGMNGGIAKCYLEMCDILKTNIDIDESKGITALWHDESHINRYHQNFPKAKILGPEYQYPEEMLMPYPKIIVNKKKNNALIRSGRRNFFYEFKKEISLVIRNIIYWFLIKLKFLKYE